eukprot:CAMPEP_0197830206 /NCGR_PEP_ID=MMETSP1437-20131217/6795_1 /TAXON_ID=49252 ORGANISM="Eucampia antarctica, Strain CCMP1452" /NCGR_SAMPLE_ID=MMETSP1437 /ASSEMBLY_ACC=CAM_ASM_001096 /LENGTH=309 /DNA_ID=CAMNT_0043432421 /DNA_START=390 /DNA_END=1322 /DNA_ORIENTATION=-
MKEFSVFFPQVISEASRKTFMHASYKYDAINTYFDNTIWTWGTDYMLAVLMMYGAIKCLFATQSATGETNNDATRPIRFLSLALLTAYSMSVFCGGIAHQYYDTLESLNTRSFQILWSLCLGSVTFATAYMGMIAAEICSNLKNNTDKNRVLFHVPIIPNWAWLFYGCYMTFFCVSGDFSCKRPASDIFIAGITQLAPTLYCEIVMLSRRWSDACIFEAKASPSTRDIVADGIKAKYRCMYYIGFILNAPLLFFYPLAVQYTSISLGILNATLHLNLCFAWGMQAISLHHICKASNRIQPASEQSIKLN